MAKNACDAVEKSAMMCTELHTSQTADQATANQIPLFFKLKKITNFHWSKRHGIAQDTKMQIPKSVQVWE